MNNVQILGTITRDIELRYTNSGTAIATFGIAFNEKRKQSDGSYGDVAHFFDVTSFGKTAENINNYFSKGSKILINGSLDYQSWTDQQGNKKSKVGIKLDSFDFIDRKDNNQKQGQQQNNYQAPQQHPRHTDYQRPPVHYQDANGRPTPPPTKRMPQQLPEIDMNSDSIPF